jgi:hypothetical protein
MRLSHSRHAYLNVPIGHCTQVLLLLAPVDSEAVPAGQLSHAVEPIRGAKDPAAHSLQVVRFEAPIVVENVPVGQGVQAVAPACSV